MKFLKKSGIRRNNVVCVILGLSMFLVPFADCIAVKFIFCIVLFLLIVNIILIIKSFISYNKKK